jgi:phosphoglycolate phosphatase
VKYRLVIFDFDGTLADSASWFVKALNDLAPRHGFRPVTEAEIEMLRGRGNREIIRYLRLAKWRLPFIAADLRRRAAADAAHISLFDGVERLLATLHRNGVTFAIVSSNSEANVRQVLGAKAAEAVSLFDCGAGLFGKAKRFRRLMKRAGVAAAETICIGDEQRDMEAAHAVGAASGAVFWGYATRDLLMRCGPTMTFERPMDIVDGVGCPHGSSDDCRDRRPRSLNRDVPSLTLEQ